MVNVFDTNREYGPDPMPLPAPVRVFRQALGLTQRDLADRAGISVGTVRNLETRRHRPNRKTAERVAAVLGVDVPEVFPEWAGYE